MSHVAPAEENVFITGSTLNIQYVWLISREESLGNPHVQLPECDSVIAFPEGW